MDSLISVYSLLTIASVVYFEGIQGVHRLKGEVTWANVVVSSLFEFRLTSPALTFRIVSVPNYLSLPPF